jgi:hypothetical protein
MCVGSLDHLDNCLESLIYLKACLKIVVFSWYVRKSLAFVSRFTSILMLEGSQLRLSNNISLLSVYLSQSKKKWWEFNLLYPIQVMTKYSENKMAMQLWFTIYNIHIIHVELA